jgi:hypothetical protein
MFRIIDQSSRRVVGRLSDGTARAFDLSLEERIEGDESIYSICIEPDGKMMGLSPEGYFSALKNLRIELEKIGILLVCFGASENVYPSAMQLSMGPAELAYRTRLGEQARREDIVNIFDSDESVSPATVEQQEKYNQEWLQSLGRTLGS